MGPGRVRFQGEMEVSFDSRISSVRDMLSSRLIIDIYALF